MPSAPSTACGPRHLHWSEAFPRRHHNRGAAGNPLGRTSVPPPGVIKFVAYAVIAVLLVLALLVSATAKLRRVPQLVDGLTSLGVPLSLFPLLAACEITGAGGLVIGLRYPPLGIAAAIGLVLYFVGAVGAHLRGRDFTGMPNAAVMLAASTAALILGAISS